MIAFIGSVFSPWYAWARRRGGGDPFDHCTMNVALYGGTRRWAMTERGRLSLHRDRDRLEIGPSSYVWDGNSLTIKVAEITSPLPRRVRGTIRVFPPGLSTHEVDLAGNARHRWRPIAPRARVEVSLDEPSLRWSGTAYFDTNSGDEPLEDAFSGWDWCRAPLRDGGTAVIYDRRLRDGGRLVTALRYDAAGRAVEFEPPARQRLHDSLWRIERSTHADEPAFGEGSLGEGATGEGARAWVAQTLEDTPFYARSVVQGRLLGQGVTSVHESLSLDRFRAGWIQAMLPFKAPRVLARWGGGGGGG